MSALAALPTAAEALRAQLGMIAGSDPAGLIECRYRLTGGRRGMGQTWVPCADPHPFIGAILGLGEQTDTYVGGAPRTERFGGKAAVRRAWALWVDCDTADAADRLRAFRPAPTMLLRSGRPGGLHGWWSLNAPLAAPEQLERALRRLAHHLGGDAACCEAARIMRAAGTYNHRRGTLVEVERLEVDAHSVAEVVGALPDPPALERSARSASSAPGDDPLRAVAPEVYIAVLAGVEVGRHGEVACPLHADSAPSLHAYPTPEEGWYCFGCERGGSVYDFAAALWGRETRGPGFTRLRREVASALLLGRAAA